MCAVSLPVEGLGQAAEVVAYSSMQMYWMHWTQVRLVHGSVKISYLVQGKICCAREERPHLKLPQFPDETPEFYKLGCCKRSQKMPSHVQACDHCGWQKKFYNVHDCVERTDGIAKWMQWESTDSTGKTNTRPVLREHTGTCTHERENKNKKYLPCFVIVILGPVFVVLSLFRRYSSRINKCHQASLSCDVVSLLGERNVQTSETSIHPGNGCMCVL